MKKIFFFTAITFITLSSCRKDLATSSKEPEAKVVSHSANNSVNTVPISDKSTYVLEGSTWNSCAQEFIDYKGTGHYEIRGMISDNKITFVLHVNASNIKAVGRTSGTEYVTTYAFNYTNTFNFNTQFVYQQNSTNNWVAKGSGLSFSVINDWHLTVNANGDVTFFFTTGGDVIECK